jgi:hypothetical protein
MEEGRMSQAGDAIQDLCRACKSVRDHTVIVADPQGTPLRVICDYCGSQHNYRGGDGGERSPRPSEPERSHAPVIEQETTAVFDSTAEGAPIADLEKLLRRVIREESGITPLAPAEKWRGGSMVLRPGKPGLQDKIWPIETFFHKVVMLRNRLRVLEQQINATEMPEDVKIKLQAYITGCYGTLTSFNILFAEEEDRFHGTAGSE